MRDFWRARETREKTRKGKMEIFNAVVIRGFRSANFASVRVFRGRSIPDGGARETREKTRKGKMEIFNAVVIRGFRSANFASVRVFRGRSIPDGGARETRGPPMSD